jgi:hypothetical protein
MRLPGVVEADPIADDAAGVLQGARSDGDEHISFSVRISRSTMPFCSGLCGVMNSCRRPLLRTSAV